MKALKNIFLFAVLCSSAVLISCGGSDDAGPTDADRLVGTWAATLVTLDNVNITEPEYADFTVTFRNDGTYITVDGDPIFTDTGGFWSVTSSTDSAVILDVDGVTMEASLSADGLTATISFTAADEVIGGRVAGLVGEYIFALSKQ